ncbi:hypothetical protein AB2B41_17275 [Marimonas sp. MJW-29]|uniref:Uncharacterized protein n=1 Tax=Sulfitobacter sediminis TaxID=3234186 RepID=A0ABV3RQT4_9RHOB
MRHWLAAAALSVLFLAPPGAALSQRTYAGEEAAALRCANTLALTAVALWRAGMIEEAEKEVMLEITILILERHVSGTWAQKKTAMAIMRDRRSVPDTLEDYQKNAARCLRQFPIN